MSKTRKLLNSLSRTTNPTTRAQVRTTLTLSNPTKSSFGYTTDSLQPPYQHSIETTSLQPSYHHSLSFQSSRIRAGRRYVLADSEIGEVVGSAGSTKGTEESWKEWAGEMLSDEQGREELERSWRNVLRDLEGVKTSGIQVPDIPFHSLSHHLTSSSLGAIKNAGVVVIRDVIQDWEAINWARDILTALEETAGRPLYWHPSLLTARAHPSLLSALSQISLALLSSETNYILSEPIQTTLHSSPSLLPPSSNPYIVNPSLSPISSLQLHLTLSPSSPISSHTITPSIHAATYASLRPLFKPIQSKISLYDPTLYLSPSNWTLIPSSSLPHISTEVSLPHLQTTSIPTLHPGDVIVRHAGLPVLGEGEQVFLPITPLRDTEANKEFIKKQRQAFERGLPPPHARVGLAVQEQEGSVGMIRSSGGRRVMGYEL
ncbi:hypothetical protein M231_04444 [Tremella mesenterica]|uniref:Uncharacterized protein n=1 Tax=Tremella mesenterica TaxID=5217 RepID=A0A4Q1BKG0_TREME|nr:hypothetical protein M231_04444 [Tremella mesenterica]